MLALLKSQVDVMKTSSKRVSTQSEQHGCVQQVGAMLLIGIVLFLLSKTHLVDSVVLLLESVYLNYKVAKKK